jgi:hypothetical protein
MRLIPIAPTKGELSKGIIIAVWKIVLPRNWYRAIINATLVPKIVEKIVVIKATKIEFKITPQSIPVIKIVLPITVTTFDLMIASMGLAKKKGLLKMRVNHAVESRPWPSVNAVRTVDNIGIIIKTTKKMIIIVS